MRLRSLEAAASYLPTHPTATVFQHPQPQINVDFKSLPKIFNFICDLLLCEITPFAPKDRGGTACCPSNMRAYAKDVFSLSIKTYFIGSYPLNIFHARKTLAHNFNRLWIIINQDKIPSKLQADNANCAGTGEEIQHSIAGVR